VDWYNANNTARSVDGMVGSGDPWEDTPTATNKKSTRPDNTM